MSITAIHFLFFFLSVLYLLYLCCITLFVFFFLFDCSVSMLHYTVWFGSHFLKVLFEYHCYTLFVFFLSVLYLLYLCCITLFGFFFLFDCSVSMLHYTVWFGSHFLKVLFEYYCHTVSVSFLCVWLFCIYVAWNYLDWITLFKGFVWAWCHALFMRIGYPEKNVSLKRRKQCTSKEKKRVTNTHKIKASGLH